jgi:hypothetical protein
MIEAFIKIRLKQFYRGFIGIGLFRFLFLILLAGYLFVFVFMLTATQQSALYIAGITALIVLFIQTKRKDKLFLKTNFNRYQFIYLVDYIVFTSIVITFLMIHMQWIPLSILLSAICLITQVDIKVKQRSLNTRLQLMIPSECFEWKAGVRQTFFILVPIWIIGFCTSFFIASVPIVLFVLGIIPILFYEQGEPYQMIVSYEMGTNRFLMHKIKMQFILFSILSLPLMIAFIVFHYEIGYIPIVEYFIFVSIHTYLILTKYAFYEPNSKSQAATTYGAIGAVSGIIPIFLPVVWLLSVRFFLKSRKNLNIYLNDFN